MVTSYPKEFIRADDQELASGADRNDVSVGSQLYLQFVTAPDYDQKEYEEDDERNQVYPRAQKGRYARFILFTESTKEI